MKTAIAARPSPRRTRYPRGGCSGGSNWYAYVNNDPVNWVDPWGLSASDAAGAGTGRVPLDPDSVVTALNPLGQLEFERAYGYGNGVTAGASCQTVAMVNAYACDGGVRVSDLNRAVAAWEDADTISVGGDYPGSVGDWTAMSQTLASEIGRDTYLEFRYPGGASRPERVTEAAFGSSGAGIGIAYLWNQGSRTQHWEVITLTQMIHSLDPQRPGAGGYALQYVQPLQTLSLPRR